MTGEPGSTSVIKTVPLTREAYAPYGDVIAIDETLPYKPANMGTSRRFNHLSKVQNLRGEQAELNVCIFSCSPLAELPLKICLLERHAFSTQIFMPMSKNSRYLAIVCLGDDQPDLSTLAAFLVDGPRGVSYHPGVWHYPMTALDQIDFTCLVHEDGTAHDCEIQKLDQPLLIEFPH